MSRKKIRLGDLLVENKIISQSQLEAALVDQRKSGRKLGRVLVDNGYILESSLLEFLSRQLDVAYVDLKQFRFDRELVRRLPEMQARRHRAMVLRAEGDGVLVAMADPTDIFAYDELVRVLKCPVELAVVSETDLLMAFDTVYRHTEAIETFAEELNEELTERDIDLGRLAVASDVSDAPVVKLLQSLFEDAVQIGASDVHIEPDEQVLRIRQRVDGVLQEQVMEEKRIASALVLRVKLMAGLDISEKRLPQDGRFTVKVKGRTVDVRLSTMPVQHGESVVMRLLDQSAGALSLDQLGMSLDIRRRFERAISQPHGMVLVTGPTGSGKTTSLYAALAALNAASTKIITVEDPVEYRLPRVQQVQVRADIGLTFGTVLRSVLRQDPDVVLVGEMRDEETVTIGLRAAITGHLVLSTLHTNDAVSTVSRLVDMGAPGYLLASALQAVVAQRLVRKVCGNCTRPYQPGDYEVSWLAARLGNERADGVLAAGEGCQRCGHTGYKGRLGVYELLEVDDAMRIALGAGDGAGFSVAAHAALGTRTLVHSALSHALRGVTSLEEVMRVAGERAPEKVLESQAHEPGAVDPPGPSAYLRAGAGAGA